MLDKLLDSVEVVVLVIVASWWESEPSVPTDPYLPSGSAAGRARAEYSAGSVAVVVIVAAVVGGLRSVGSDQTIRTRSTPVSVVSEWSVKDMDVMAMYAYLRGLL